MAGRSSTGGALVYNGKRTKHQYSTGHADMLLYLNINHERSGRVLVDLRIFQVGGLV